MDIMRVDRTNFTPDLLIEDCTSKIWTERYQEPGDFELKTNRVDKLLKILPEMSLLTHRDTAEVMFVETHTIGKDSNGQSELTIKGRSLDAFIENRYLEGPYPKKKYKMSKTYTAAQASVVLLWNCLVNPSTKDVTRNGDFVRSVLDKVPDTVVTNSTDVTGTIKKRWLSGGQMYPQLMDLLKQDKLGIRTIRPVTSSAKVASVETTTDSGFITYVNNETINHLRWDIYNGFDRRLSQPDRKEVVFHYDSGHLEDPSYLYSIAEYKTMAFVISSTGINRIYRDKPGDSVLAGLDRRSIWVDGGEPVLDTTEPTELLDYPVLNTQEPTANKSQAQINAENDATIAEWRADNADIRAANAAVRTSNAAIMEEFLENLPEVGEVALEKTDRIDLFDGKVSAEVPYVYNRDYYLGDKVTILAEYDFKQTMRVSEYVRTEDAQGDRGYPGLVITL